MSILMGVDPEPFLEDTSWQMLVEYLTGIKATKLVAANESPPQPAVNNERRDDELNCGYDSFHDLRCWLRNQQTHSPMYDAEGKYNCEPLERLWVESPRFSLGSKIWWRLFNDTAGPHAMAPHLFYCNDSHAVFVPWDFEHPVYVEEDTKSSLLFRSVGSTPRLLAELDDVAQLLQLPENLPFGELWDTDSNGPPWIAHARVASLCNDFRHLTRRAIQRTEFINFW